MRLLLLLLLGVVAVGEGGFFTQLVTNVKDFEGRAAQAFAGNSAEAAGAKLMSSQDGRRAVSNMRSGRLLTPTGVGKIAEATGRSSASVVGTYAKDAVINGRIPKAGSDSDGGWAAKLDRRVDSLAKQLDQAAKDAKSAAQVGAKAAKAAYKEFDDGAREELRGAKAWAGQLGADAQDAAYGALGETGAQRKGRHLKAAAPGIQERYDKRALGPDDFDAVAKATGFSVERVILGYGKQVFYADAQARREQGNSGSGNAAAAAAGSVRGGSSSGGARGRTSGAVSSWSPSDARVLETKVIEAATDHELRSAIGSGPTKAAETLFLQKTADEAAAKQSASSFPSSFPAAAARMSKAPAAPEYGSRAWREACKRNFERSVAQMYARDAARENNPRFTEWRREQVAAQQKKIIEASAEFKEDQARRKRRMEEGTKQNEAWHREHERLAQMRANANKAVLKAAEEALERKKQAQARADAESRQRARLMIQEFHAKQRARDEALKEERQKLDKLQATLDDRHRREAEGRHAIEAYLAEQRAESDKRLRARINDAWPTAAAFLEAAIAQVDDLKQTGDFSKELGALDALVHLRAAFAILRETDTPEGYAFGSPTAAPGGGFIPAVEEALRAYDFKGGFFKHFLSGRGSEGLAARAYQALVSGEAGGNGFLPAALQQVEALDVLALEVGPRQSRYVAAVLAQKQAPAAADVEEEDPDDEEGGDGGEDDDGDDKDDDGLVDAVWGAGVLVAEKGGKGEIKPHRRSHHHRRSRRGSSRHRSSSSSSSSSSSHRRRRHRSSSSSGGGGGGGESPSKRCCCCQGRRLLQGVGASSSTSCKSACEDEYDEGAIYFDKVDPEGSCRSRWTAKCAPKKSNRVV